MRIGLVVPSYNKPDMTKECVESALLSLQDKGTELRIDVVNHWQDSLQGFSYGLPMRDNSPIRVYDYRRNRGLALTWNESIHRFYWEENCDAVIVANADIFFNEGSLEMLAQSAVEMDYTHGIVWCEGEHSQFGEGHSMGYSLFTVTRLGMNTVGYFDTNYFPAYVEDCDHHRRLCLAGVPHGHCDFGGDKAAVQHIGSAHIRLARGEEGLALQQRIESAHQENKLYFKRKWGFMPGDKPIETVGENAYFHPFNDGRLGFFIPWETQRNPYLDHKRINAEV